MHSEHCCNNYVSVNAEAVNPYVGPAGFSPEVNVEKTETGYLVKITDAEGEKSFEIRDGVDGINGEDGVTPEIAVETIDGGHLVTITDAEGEKSFEIKDGVDGVDGTTPTLDTFNASNTNVRITDLNKYVMTGALFYMMNRSTSVAASDTSYTSFIARGESLQPTGAYPGINGTISWRYE